MIAASGRHYTNQSVVPSLEALKRLSIPEHRVVDIRS